MRYQTSSSSSLPPRKTAAVGEAPTSGALSVAFSTATQRNLTMSPFSFSACFGLACFHHITIQQPQAFDPVVISHPPVCAAISAATLALQLGHPPIRDLARSARPASNRFNINPTIGAKHTGILLQELIRFVRIGPGREMGNNTPRVGAEFRT